MVDPAPRLGRGDQDDLRHIIASLTTANGNASNGLVPAWCASNNNVISGSQAGPYHYQYDSCRTPFRIALDWCWFGETRAKDYLTKTSNFFSGIGAANIVDGYELTGAKKVQFSPATAAPTHRAAVGVISGPGGRRRDDFQHVPDVHQR